MPINQPQLYFSLWVMVSLAAQAAYPDYITYDNKRMGTPEKPYILRTYIPNLELDDEVLSHHSRGFPSPTYSPSNGRLSKSGMYKTIPVIPASVSVSCGPQLAYAWDTTECRLLYAWANGFLDMESHWGAPNSGRRNGNYSARLFGQVFYKAKGKPPLQINGKPQSAAVSYHGNKRIKGHPEFSYAADGRKITVSVRPGPAVQTVEVQYVSSDQSDTLGYVDPKTPFEVLDSKKGSLKVLLRPNVAETYHGFKRPNVKIADASAEVGKALYTTFGCIACHTLDGAKNHGPTFQSLFDSKRDFPKHGLITADENYLRESITKPNTKTVPGFTPGMMPPYPLDSKQVDSLVLFIKSLK
jgi:cytochrome c oxidase subunit 2